jgi:hypothetical protein
MTDSPTHLILAAFNSMSKERRDKNPIITFGVTGVGGESKLTGKFAFHEEGIEICSEIRSYIFFPSHSTACISISLSRSA